MDDAEREAERAYRRGFDQGFYVAKILSQKGQTVTEMNDLGHIIHYFWRCGGLKKYDVPPVEHDIEKNREIIKKNKRKLTALRKVWIMRY